MRVSTSQIYSIADIGMRDAQSAVNKTSEQMSTGKRVLSPADDPVAATTILRLNQNLGRLEQFGKNIDAAQNNLDQEEVALESVVNLITRMKELAVQAGNTGVMTSGDYKALAAEVDTRIDELMDLQNTRNNSGQYIFAGHQGSKAPFEALGGGNFAYKGDEGQMRIQISETASVPATDSGKRLFVDVPSSHATFNTAPSSGNIADPPARISVGQVVDEEAYGEFYPRDMKVTFNAPESVNPPAANYTVTDDRGRVIVANAPYNAGDPIEVNGAQFRISGQPYAGEAATPATLDFGPGFTAQDFTATPETVTLSVGGKTETLQLDGPVNSMADLAAMLNANNPDELASLGVVVDANGLQVPNGQSMTLRNGSANTDAVFGFATQNAGSTSTDGELATPGDSFLVQSSDKQGLLTTLSRFADAMRNVEDSTEGKAAVGDQIAKTLSNLDLALETVTTVQGELGARMNTLESAGSLNEDTKMHSEELLSDVQDLDYAEASTRLQMQNLVLTAAQQSFVKISGLSLFNFL